MTPIELHKAYYFACEDCGRDNFVRAITLEPEMVKAMAEEMGEDDAEEFEEIAKRFHEFMAANQDSDLDFSGGISFEMCPKVVACNYCGAEFRTFEGEQDE